MMIEIAEFNGAHGAALIKEIVPKFLPIFERIGENPQKLRVTNPAILMRSFIGMVFRT
jgi:hypothetical protein